MRVEREREREREREIMLFIGKPMGRSMMISKHYACCINVIYFEANTT